jgi:hypothetical protein
MNLRRESPLPGVSASPTLRSNRFAHGSDWSDGFRIGAMSEAIGLPKLNEKRQRTGELRTHTQISIVINLTIIGHLQSFPTAD